MVVAIIGNGFRRFDSPIPLAGSCSFAISAACHPEKDDEDAAYRPVSWGQVKRSYGHGNEEVYHCALTSQEVEQPIPGRLYAGMYHEVGAQSLRHRRDKGYT